MKIKTTAWHYRLWRLGREGSYHQPRDLCRYFWHLFLIKILLPVAVVFLALFGIGTLLYTIWSNPITTAIIVGVIVLAVVLLIGFVFLIRKLVERNRRLAKERKLLPPEPDPEPSVLFTYLAARKRKICPLIEVVKEERKV